MRFVFCLLLLLTHQICWGVYSLNLKSIPPEKKGPAFHIEGEEGTLDEREIELDMKSLERNFNLPEKVTVIEKGQEKKERVIQKFKIAAAAGMASKHQVTNHPTLSNASPMLKHKKKEAQTSLEGYAPDWVTAAKIKEMGG